MLNYFSPSTVGFYNDDVHGPREIPDPNFSGDGEAPLISNPDTKIPVDAVEITPEEKAAVFAAQSAGQVIAAGPDGKPIAVDPPPLPPEQLTANLRATRDIRLTASDWTQLADAPLDSSKKAAWVAYRQALRDLPANTADPAQVSWPVPPT
jgi:hypothetical protein